MRVILIFLAGIGLSVGAISWMLHGASLQEGLLTLATGGALMYLSLFITCRIQ